MYNKFKEYDSFNLSGINKEMLDDWTRQGLFGQSIKEREGSPSFVFYEAAVGQRYAGHPSRDGSYDQGYFLPLQDHERFSCEA